MIGEPPADQVEQLAAWLSGTDIELLELRTPEGTIRLQRDRPGVAATLERTGAAVALLAVTAPSVGVFLHCHPLQEVVLVHPGQKVRAGEPVGLLRIGTLLLPVPAPVDGMVLDLPVADGSTVGYGAVLARLRPI
jgi:acetyl-CoA carboxylase biotin carboxyl carrier protein